MSVAHGHWRLIWSSMQIRKAPAASWPSNEAARESRLAHWAPTFKPVDLDSLGLHDAESAKFKELNLLGLSCGEARGLKAAPNHKLPRAWSGCLIYLDGNYCTSMMRCLVTIMVRKGRLLSRR